MAAKKKITKKTTTKSKVNIQDQEYQKLQNLFVDVPANKQELVEGLIQNASFMVATLSDLQKQIKKDGAIITAQNGNGFMVANENPAQKSYNTMINRYTALMKTLIEMLPDKASAKSKLELLRDE